MYPFKPYGSGKQPASYFRDHHFDTLPAYDTIDIEQFRRWIEHCDTEHHSQCHSIDPNHFFQFPEQITLIDVECSKISVCKTKQRYAALSYVWGKSNENLATIKSNLSDLSRDGGLLNRWDELPATVRDAIILCKKLGIQYLWVDRLCIVQDDDDSKRQNIPWMASIYANCYLAIIVAQGSDANHGIRGIGTSSGSRNGSFSFPFDDIRGLSDMPEWESIWHTRGWTFQERVLPRRCLIFHDQTVHWQCRRMHVEENQSIPIGGLEPKIIRYYDQSQDYHRYDRKHQLQLDVWPDPSEFGRLCREFSRRNLTYERDAMNAFTAITTALSRIFPGGFLYAMPEYVFTTSLLWSFNYSLSELKRREWLPSWSWIGWKGSGLDMLDLRSPVMEYCSLGYYGYYHPMSKWAKRNAHTNQVLSINENVHYLWENYPKEPTEPLPQGWTFHQDTDIFDNTPFFQHEEFAWRNPPVRFQHPVPILEPGPITPDLTTWDTKIHGKVSLALVKFDRMTDIEGSIFHTSICFPLNDSFGHRVGKMDVDYGDFSGTEHDNECAAISLCSMRENFTLD
jgi:hypothetical protein